MAGIKISGSLNNSNYNYWGNMYGDLKDQKDLISELDSRDEVIDGKIEEAMYQRKQEIIDAVASKQDKLVETETVKIQENSIKLSTLTNSDIQDIWNQGGSL